MCMSTHLTFLLPLLLSPFFPFLFCYYSTHRSLLSLNAMAPAAPNCVTSTRCTESSRIVMASVACITSVRRTPPLCLCLCLCVCMSLVCLTLTCHLSLTHSHTHTHTLTLTRSTTFYRYPRYLQRDGDGLIGPIPGGSV